MAKIHRFIDNFDLPTAEANFLQKEFKIEGEIAHQIIKVLKLEAGEKIELGDGKGTVAFGRINPADLLYRKFQSR